ncbi:alpha/beta hydrolase-fold protein [Aquimarina spongiae]|uniref:Uncharacterized protein n=1 Tax=Aquimarina spongiae TaxID=570521 RepID=A0A1M6DXB8_9FLAO|nr:alpha/beta hydrolase-fold protein [Aquimarina spongiae]SHI77769.1 hypothetical protein SAMN04488508_10367 [Aquimarina spongiae]
MKNISLFLFLISIHFQINAQFCENEKNEIVIGIADSLYSHVLKEQRDIWIHLPEEIEKGKKYPVIYVLNSPRHFYPVTGMLKLLEEFDIPKSIVVGITNTDSTRDFTPTNVLKGRQGRSVETSGGASNFLEFMQCELAPFLENKYPADKMSTIVGHSLGGLFTIYAYVNHPDVFDNYLAIDPSLWWDKENLVKQSKELLEKDNYQNKSLHLAVANSYKVDTVKVRRMDDEPTEGLRANLKFHDILVENQKHLETSWKYYPEEDHGGIVTLGMYNGLRSVYKWYKFEERWRFNTPKRYSKEELTQPFYDHFNKLSVRFKRDKKPNWEFVNELGFFMLDVHDLPKKAKAYLDINLHFYPEESRSYVAMGDFYLKTKERKKAIEHYQKAIGIDGNKDAQKKLKKLTK